ncbi:hypothetical protein [Sutcliffiella rhizosphaerae]|uniref:Uncharacterized protein n=1 Tax=Sutcliffiella rhizosphaerae TaxID=2880967 RepID=A0ABN8A7A3_9BACI|nr:hypothetical protein [Sutcliffiella rhizosphaerae]CAG9620968.1 hypothetical protein BACCIP111883_01740 [Sutcliffiella rhizosphaerae]
MKKYKILLIGTILGFMVSLLYAVFIRLSDPMWGDLTAIASFMVLFPISILLSLLLQLGILIFQKYKR